MKKKTPSCLEIITWATKPILETNPKPVIVMDSYYPTEEVLKFLRDNSIPYLAGTNSQRFHAVDSTLKRKTKKIESFSAAVNSNREEIALCYYDEDLGKRVLHTTFFDQVSTSNQNHMDIFYSYGHLFNVVDGFNKLISLFKWPFTRNQWQNNFDSFFWITTLINVWVLYCERKNDMLFEDFLEKLSEELINL